MKKFIGGAGVLLPLILSGNVIGSDGYRIAGIIASGAADWQAIVELPDGEQKVVTEGDYLGRVEIVQISKQGVTLRFPGGKRQMQLSRGDYISQPVETALGTVLQNGVDDSGRSGAIQASNKGEMPRLPGSGQMPRGQGDNITRPADAVPGSGPQGEAGVAVSDYSKMVDKKLDPGLLAGVTGLEALNRLSASARIVAYSYLGDPQQARTPINSVESGVNLLHQAIVEEKGLRITVEGDESLPDFYVMPLPE
jgi:hypothetical protein